MKRREFLVASAAATAVPSLVRANTSRVLRFIPSVDLTVLDPHWTAASITRNHTYLVFDTLFGMDGSYRMSPQMAEGYQVDDDGKRWTLTLREGLKFHDGEPVLARDCVASIRRWAQRHAFGQALMAATDGLAATDDRTISFRLKKPFPLLPDALGTVVPPVAAIMPERMAKTDAFTQVKEVIGSGPYRFKADERLAGARVVYERFADYRPRERGTPDWTAGPKIVHFDRVQWTVIPEASTAAAALQTGEQDWWEAVNLDLLPRLRRERNIKTIGLDPSGSIAFMCMNHQQAPFDNPGIRRALMGAVNQEDFMQAAAGTDLSMWRTGVGFFCPTSPMANTAGLEALTSPRDVKRVREQIAAAGYKGERVVLIAPGDLGHLKRWADVGADMMVKVGLNIDYQLTDWGTMQQRRQKMDPVDQGGWSCYFSGIDGTTALSPAVNFLLRGNGIKGYLGWPTSAKIEELRDAWFDAPDLAAQQRIAAELQLQAFQDVPYIPLGQYYPHTAYRTDLTDVLNGFAVFWNVRRKG